MTSTEGTGRLATDAVPEQVPVQAWDGPLGDLYRTDHNRFLGLAYVFLGSRSAAEDVVQEAFMAVADRVSEVDKLEPYLRQAVVNRCRSVLRRRATAERHARIHRHLMRRPTWLSYGTCCSVSPGSSERLLCCGTWRVCLTKRSPRSSGARGQRFDLTPHEVLRICGRSCHDP